MIYVINFADDKFAKQQHDNTKTAYSKGKADKVIEYSPMDIDNNFKQKNSQIFAFERGHGLWIWKSYLILKTLNIMSEGDFLFYCDSGSYFINDLHYLTKIMDERNLDIMPFGLPLLEMQWTKKETYIKVGIDDYSFNQVLATYIMIRNNAFSRAFFDEWMNYMSDLQCSSPMSISPVKNFKNFIEHREDQSVFSLLVHKYNLEVFRDPSQFGEWPWLYKTEDKVIYNPQKYENSKYPRLLVSNRRILMEKYKYLIFIKDIIDILGLYHLLYRLKRTLTSNLFRK